jgi:hypothetical protein
MYTLGYISKQGREVHELIPRAPVERLHSHPSDSGAHRPRRYLLSGLRLTTFSIPQEAGRYAALIAARLATGKSS